MVKLYKNLVTLAKTAILLSVILFTLQSNAQTSRIDNENFSLRYPSFWEHEDINIGPMLLSVMASPDGDNLYMVISFGHYMDMNNFLQQQVVNKMNDIFKDSESGEIYTGSYHGREVQVVNSDVKFEGTDYKAKTFGFTENGKSFMIVEMTAKGSYHDFSDIANTLIVKDKTEDKMDARTYVTKFVNDLKKTGLNSYIDEGVKFSNLDIAPDRDRLIYSYTFKMLEKDNINTSALGDFKSELKEIFISMLKENYVTNEMLRVCMDENFDFLYKIYDKNGRFLVDVLVGPKEYK